MPKKAPYVRNSRPGAAGGDQSGAHKGQADKDAAQSGGVFCTDPGEQDAAEEMADHGKGPHHCGGICHDFCIPALHGGQRCDKDGRRVYDTCRQHDDQSANQNPGAVYTALADDLVCHECHTSLNYELLSVAVSPPF